MKWYAIPIKETRAVIKKKVKLIPMDVLASSPNHLAPYRKVTSRLPIPPMVNGITDTMDEIKKTKRYSMASSVTDNDLKIKSAQTNCANCTSAEYPKDFQKTGRVVGKNDLFTNQNTTTLAGMAAINSQKKDWRNAFSDSKARAQAYTNSNSIPLNRSSSRLETTFLVPG